MFSIESKAVTGRVQSGHLEVTNRGVGGYKDQGNHGPMSNDETSKAASSRRTPQARSQEKPKRSSCDRFGRCRALRLVSDQGSDINYVDRIDRSITGTS